VNSAISSATVTGEALIVMVEENRAAAVKTLKSMSAERSGTTRIQEKEREGPEKARQGHLRDLKTLRTVGTG
jgi:hypothetical protein